MKKVTNFFSGTKEFIGFILLVIIVLVIMGIIWTYEKLVKICLTKKAYERRTERILQKEKEAAIRFNERTKNMGWACQPNGF